mgnify:CR=1 FL=1
MREEDGVKYLRHDCWRMERMSDEDAALVREITGFVKGCGKERLEAFVRWLIRHFEEGEEICMELLAFDLNERWERQEEERIYNELERMVKGSFKIREVRELIERLRESVMRGYIYEGGRKYWLMELEKRRKERDRLEEIVRESNKRVENQLRNWRESEV